MIPHKPRLQEHAEAAYGDPRRPGIRESSLLDSDSEDDDEDDLDESEGRAFAERITEQSVRRPTKATQTKAERRSRAFVDWLTE